MTELRGVDQAAAHIHGICLKTGPPERVGVELEWLALPVHLLGTEFRWAREQAAAAA